MAIIALVSATTEHDRHRLAELAGPDWQVVDCRDDRSRLTAAGDQVAIVYGMVSAEHFRQLPQLRWVQCSWSGIDNVLHDALRHSDVLVTNVRGAWANTMAEHILAGLLYFGRCLDRHAQATDWKADRRHWPHQTLAGSSCCIFGAGSIAAALIPRLQACGCRCLAVTRRGRPVAGAAQNFTSEALPEALAASHHLVILAPSTPATRGRFDRATLEGLRPGGVLVNASRGDLLIEADFLACLDSGRLAGACLDVTDPEPPAADSPLWNHPRVLLTGHCAAMGGEADQRPFEVFLHNCRHFLAGDLDGMRCVVDKEAGY